jgi:hypothetical protein
MTMLSPRQIWAYLELAKKLDRADRANDLWVTATGTHGNAESINKAIKELGG